MQDASLRATGFRETRAWAREAPFTMFAWAMHEKVSAPAAHLTGRHQMPQVMGSVVQGRTYMLAVFLRYHEALGPESVDEQRLCA